MAIRKIFVLLLLIVAVFDSAFADDFSLPQNSGSETIDFSATINSYAGGRLEYTRDGVNWTFVTSFSGTASVVPSYSEAVHLTLINGNYSFRYSPYAYTCDSGNGGPGPCYKKIDYTRAPAQFKSITVTAPPRGTTDVYVTPAVLSCTTNFSISWPAVNLLDTATTYKIEESARPANGTWSGWRELISNYGNTDYKLPSGMASNWEYKYRISAKFTQNGFDSPYGPPYESHVITKPDCQSGFTQLGAESMNNVIMLEFTAPNAAGISYNRLPTFDYNNASLKIMNINGRTKNIFGGSDLQTVINKEVIAASQLIVIDTDYLNLKNVNIEVIGSPVDIIFLNTKERGQAYCMGCDFKNFGRITFGAAKFGSGISANTTTIGEIIPYISSAANVGGRDINAAGAASFDLIGHSIMITGRINTNVKGRNINGNYVVDPLGDLTLGSGGVNIFTGGLALDYEGQKINRGWPTPTSGTDSSGLTIEDTGSINSASIKLNSYNWSNLKGTLNTKSAALVSTVYRGRRLMPLETVSLQTFSATSMLGVYGAVTSDNEILLQSNGNVSVGNLLSAPKIVTIAKDAVKNLSTANYSAQNSVQIAADNLDNRGNIQAKSISVTTDRHILNQFGGEIKGNSVRLKSQTGIVRNGSLKPYEIVGGATDALIYKAGYETASYQQGTYFSLNNTYQNYIKPTSLTAKIVGAQVDISGNEVDNINPYYKVRKTGDDWSQGVPFQPQYLSGVEILATNNLRIHGDSSITNSSAAMGVLTSNGKLELEAPSIVNERYFIDVSIDASATYSETTKTVYSPNSTTQVAGPMTTGANTTTFTTTDAISSPPGQIYSMGAFDLNATKSFLNKTSFVEVQGDARLRSPAMKNIGLLLGQGIRTTYSIVYCSPYIGQAYYGLIQQYGLSVNPCDSNNLPPISNYSKNIGSEDTLFALRGNVQGDKATYIPSSVSSFDDIKADALKISTSIQSTNSAGVITTTTVRSNDGTNVSLNVQTCNGTTCSNTSVTESIFNWMSEFINNLKQKILSAWDLIVNWFA